MYASGLMAFTRRRNSCQNESSSISFGTSSRQPSTPNRIQCSATSHRNARTARLSVLNFGSARLPHHAA